MLLNETSNPLARPAKNPREKVRAGERIWVVPMVTTLSALPLRLGDDSSKSRRGQPGDRTRTNSLAFEKIDMRVK